MSIFSFLEVMRPTYFKNIYIPLVVKGLKNDDSLEKLIFSKINFIIIVPLEIMQLLSEALFSTIKNKKIFLREGILK